MIIAESIVGILIAAYGILGILSGRSFLFGGNYDRFKEQSVHLFARLSGIAEIVIGLATIAYAMGQLTAFPIVISWISTSIIWLSVAVIITLYLVVLIRK